MQTQRTARALPEGYVARKFEVHVGGFRWAKANPEGYEGHREYKTERGARNFAERASAHFGKTAHIVEWWSRGGWWTGGLDGQLAATYRDGECVDERRKEG